MLSSYVESYDKVSLPKVLGGSKMLYTEDLLTADVSEWLDRSLVAAIMGLKPCETLLQYELVVKSVARSGAGTGAVLD